MQDKIFIEICFYEKNEKNHSSNTSKLIGALCMPYSQYSEIQDEIIDFILKKGLSGWVSIDFFESYISDVVITYIKKNKITSFVLAVNSYVEDTSDCGFSISFSNKLIDFLSEKNSNIGFGIYELTSCSLDRRQEIKLKKIKYGGFCHNEILDLKSWIKSFTG
jgi:hypothetical protein